MTNPPTGTVTFMFTDLEGSTALWEQNPKAMNEALAWHDHVLRRAIEAHGGYVFATAGDGLAAAFSDPMQGAAAAVEVQQAISAREWGNDIGVLRVRIGLDTGIAEERDGDYFGPAVNRAARVMGLAEGGEVLASHTAADLLRHHLEDGVRIVEVGERQLKGVTRPEVIFAIQYGPQPESETETSRHAWVPIALIGGVGLLVLTVGLIIANPFGSTEPASPSGIQAPSAADTSVGFAEPVEGEWEARHVVDESNMVMTVATTDVDLGIIEIYFRGNRAAGACAPAAVFEATDVDGRFDDGTSNPEGKLLLQAVFTLDKVECEGKAVPNAGVFPISITWELLPDGTLHDGVNIWRRVGK